MRKLVLGMTLLACGCVQHTFVPGPGMSAASLKSDSAQCRLFARGMKTGFAFQASGSPKFVAASTGGAAIGYAIGSAIEQNSNFNDCMEARGWLVADGQRPVAAVTVAPTATPEQPPEATTLVSVTEQPPNTSRRRRFLVRAIDVPFVINDFRPPHGVMILEVGNGGAASSAGLQERDVILDLNGSPTDNLEDLQRALDLIGPNITVMANIRRDGKEMPVAVHF